MKFWGVGVVLRAGACVRYACAVFPSHYVNLTNLV